MNVSTTLTLFIVSGCIITIAAMIVGLNQALKRANWPVRERRLNVQLVSAALLGWFAVAVGLAYANVYRTGSGGLPTIQFGIVIPILLGGLVIWRSSALSRLMDAVPRHWVIAVQSYRLEGVVFLLLYFVGQLPGLFALPAGAGDFAIGLFAVTIGIGASRGHQLRARTVLRWNLLGILDLIVALTTGLLTSPSQLQRFAFDHPNQFISAFPLVLIPTFLVPLAILLHTVSLMQLRRLGTRIGNFAGPHLSLEV